MSGSGNNSKRDKCSSCDLVHLCGVEIACCGSAAQKGTSNELSVDDCMGKKSWSTRDSDAPQVVQNTAAPMTFSNARIDFERQRSVPNISLQEAPDFPVGLSSAAGASPMTTQVRSPPGGLSGPTITNSDHLAPETKFESRIHSMASRDLDESQTDGKLRRAVSREGQEALRALRQGEAVIGALLLTNAEQDVFESRNADDAFREDGQGSDVSDDTSEVGEVQIGALPRSLSTEGFEMNTVGIEKMAQKASKHTADAEAASKSQQGFEDDIVRAKSFIREAQSRTIIETRLREAAKKAYGFWDIRGADLTPCVDAILEVWGGTDGFEHSRRTGFGPVKRRNSFMKGLDKLDKAVHFILPTRNPSRRRSTMTSLSFAGGSNASSKAYHLFGLSSGATAAYQPKLTEKRQNTALVVFSVICLLGCIYKAIEMSFHDAFDVIGPGLLFARGAAVGTLHYTILLFLSMNRSVITFLYCHTKAPLLLHNQRLHFFSASQLIIYSFIHVAAHLSASVPALIDTPYEDLNTALNCAQPDFSNALEVLQFPTCPLEEQPTLPSVLSSVPGATGILLAVILLVMKISSGHSYRKKNYEKFQVLHFVMFYLWVIVLIVHGSNQWLGVGFPLALVCCVPFLAAYEIWRLRRNLFAEVFTVERANIVSSKLIYLTIRQPPRSRFGDHLVPGMYVQLCCPEISKFEWHPFSIAFSGHDTITFLISPCGSWTSDLARLIREKRLTGIRVAGPFTAAAESLSREGNQKIIVSIGAGVGITPFLGSMEGLLRSGGVPSGKVVYFYWLARSASDFILAEDILVKLAKEPNVVLKLHVTSNPDPRECPDASLLRAAVARQGGAEDLDVIEVSPPNHPDVKLPVFFGRPNWAADFRAQGDFLFDSSSSSFLPERTKVWVYVCGNTQLQTAVAKGCAEQPSDRRYRLMIEEF